MPSLIARRTWVRGLDLNLIVSDDRPPHSAGGPVTFARARGRNRQQTPRFIHPLNVNFLILVALISTHLEA